MKSLTLLALLLAGQSAPRPAWEAADRWTCTMTQLRVCTGLGGECEIHGNDAEFHIDFPAARFGVTISPSLYTASAAATGSTDYSEKILARVWLAPQNKDPGFAKLSLDSGDSFTFSGVTRPGGETREAVFTRNQVDRQYHWYGTCSPDAAAKP